MRFLTNCFSKPDFSGKHNLITTGLLSIFLCLAVNSGAATPLGGLTVAISPDGNTLVASGTNRTFYRMDPATLSVKERVWHGLSVTDMAYSKDGTVLAVADAGMGGIVTLFDAKNLLRRTDVRDCDMAAFSTEANLFAGIQGNRSDKATLHVFGLNNGSPIMKVGITPKRQVMAVALDLKGTLAAVIYEGQTDPSEEKSTPDSALKGFDRTIAMQKTDGRTSLVEFYEIPSGKKSTGHTLHYTSSGQTKAVISDDRVIVVNYQNQNAVIGRDGSVTMFECANSFNYGIGFSSDHSVVLTGGLANFSITGTADLISREVNVRERLPSWPEYFRGFAANATGYCYGATDGYRVLVIDRNASIILEKPAY